MDRITVTNLYNIKPSTLCIKCETLENVFLTSNYIIVVANSFIAQYTIKEFQFVKSIPLKKNNVIRQIVEKANIIFIIFQKQSSIMTIIDNNVYYLEGHLSEINVLWIIENFLISGSADYTIRKWDIKSNFFGICSKNEDKVYVLSGHKGKINCLKSYQTLLLSGSEDKSLKIWKDKDNISTLKFESAIKIIESCEQSEQIAVYQASNIISIVKLGHFYQRLCHKQLVPSLKIQRKINLEQNGALKAIRQIDQSFIVCCDEQQITFIQLNLGEKIRMIEWNQITNMFVIGKFIILGKFGLGVQLIKL